MSLDQTAIYEAAGLLNDALEMLYDVREVPLWEAQQFAQEDPARQPFRDISEEIVAAIERIYVQIQAQA